MSKIEKVATSKEGRLEIYPEFVEEKFAFVYRAGKGVSWISEKKCFQSDLPKTWDLVTWYENMVLAIESELGVQLTVSNSTKFIVESELERQIRQIV